MSLTCHVHLYTTAVQQCPECHQPICPDCAQHGGTFDGKWRCPACMKLYCENGLPKWKKEKTRSIVILVISLVLMLSALIIALATRYSAVAFFLCGLAGLPMVAKWKGIANLFKGAGKGATVEDAMAGSCLVILLGIIIIFVLGAIAAIVNIIILSVSIASLSKKISGAGPWIDNMKQYMASAWAKNQEDAVIAEQQAKENAREEQRLQEERAERAAAKRKADEQEIAARAAARIAPRRELYLLILTDPGPYPQDIINEFKKRAGRQLTALEADMELATGLTKEKADEIEEALEALGAQVESRRC